MGKTWMIASGKGGVGKSTVAAGLAVLFARSGMRVLLVDGDIGLRCLDMMLGMQDSMLYELADCVEKRCALTDAAIAHPDYPSLYLMAGGQNVRPGDFGRGEMQKIFLTLRKYYDMILLDCPAGLGKGLRNMADVADEALLVATPDAACLRDTEKISALLFERRGLRASLAVNRYDEKARRLGLIEDPAAAALALDMPLLGILPNDQGVYRAMLGRRTMADCGAKRVEENLRYLAARMQGSDIPLARDTESGFRRFVRRKRGGEGR